MKTGRVDFAEELYKVLLEDTSNESKQAVYHHQLASIKNYKGDFEKTIFEIERKIFFFIPSFSDYFLQWQRIFVFQK